MAEAAKERQSTVGAGALGSAAVIPRRKFDVVRDSNDTEPELEPSELDTPSAPKETTETKSAGKKSKPAKKPLKGEGERKTRVSFHLTEALADRVRNTVYHLSGPPHRLNMAKIAEEALEAVCKKYERDQNSGNLFPQRDEDLVGGRQVK